MTNGIRARVKLNCISFMFTVLWVHTFRIHGMKQWKQQFNSCFKSKIWSILWDLNKAPWRLEWLDLISWCRDETDIHLLRSIVLIYMNLNEGYKYVNTQNVW